MQAHCEMDDPDCRPPQHKHFNDNDVVENLVMSLIDSRGLNRHRHAHRPNQSTDLSSTSSVCLCHAQ